MPKDRLDFEIFLENEFIVLSIFYMTGSYKYNSLRDERTSSLTAHRNRILSAIHTSRLYLLPLGMPPHIGICHSQHQTTIQNPQKECWVK